MTDPTAAKTVRLGKGKTARKYSWPPGNHPEFTVTSVTTATKDGYPTPWLIGWAAKATAEAAVKDFDVLELFMGKDDKKAAIAHLKGARFRDMNDKADRGTIVHAALEAYLNGKPLTKKQVQDRLEEKLVPKKMWKGTAGMIAGLMEFLWDTEPEVFWAEQTVYNRTHQYAGTADVLGRLRIGSGLHNAVIDVKTSKSIYDEVAMQLCAYGRAEFVGLDDGAEVPLIPALEGRPSVAKKKAHQAIVDEGFPYGIVVRPKTDGTYERADFDLNDRVFELFLSCLATANAAHDDVLAKSRRPGSRPGG